MSNIKDVIIPEGWKNITIKELLSTVIDNRGKTPPLSDNGYEIIEINALSKNKPNVNFKNISKYVNDEVYKKWFRGYIGKGDILVSTVGSVGITALLNSHRGAIAQNLIALRVNQKYCSKYLYYFTETAEYDRQLRIVVMNAVQPSLKVPYLLGFNLPIPKPLQEQEKIAEILSTVDEAIEKTDSLIEKYKKIKTGLLEDLFTKGIDVNTGKPHTKFKDSELGKVPESWDVDELGNICSNIGYGVGASAIDYDGKNKYLRITDIDDETRSFVSHSLVSPDFGIENRYKLNENDIVFARTGASVGKTYIYNKNDGDLYCAGFLIKFTVTKANSFFIFNQTLRGVYYNWVHLMSLRSGQPGINAEEYKSFKVALPNILEQNKISEILLEANGKIEKEILYKEKLEKIKKGLMNDLLTGKIRVKY